MTATIWMYLKNGLKVLTPAAGLDERCSTIVVELAGDKNCTSRDFVALAEFKCSAVRVTVDCKLSSKLSAANESKCNKF